MSDSPLVCRCYRVHADEIRKAVVDRKLTSVEAVTEETGAAGGCGSCYDDVQAILDSAAGTQRRAKEPARPALSVSQLRILIFGAIDRHVSPLFALNGVTVDVIAVEPERVLARLAGRNVGTIQPGILTLKWYLVKIMSDACGRKIGLIEMNIVESEGQAAAPTE